MSILSDIGGFLKDNKEIISFGGDIGKYFIDSNARNNVSDVYKDADRRAQENWEAYKQYQQNAYNIALQNAGASRAAAAARRAAAEETEKRRQEALKRAKKRESKGYKNAIAMYKPYVDVGAELLPQMSQAYQGGLKSLTEFLNKPREAAGPSWGIDIPLPDYMKEEK